MNNPSVYVASESNTDTFSDEDIYIPEKSVLKQFIEKTARLVELSKKENLSYREKKELEQLAESAHSQAKQRMSDLYPEFRQ